jgi:hypothetical protein
VWFSTRRLLYAPYTPGSRFFRDDERDPLSLVVDEPINQHEADEGLAEADSVAQESTTVRARDLQERVVAFLLVLIEYLIHPRDLLLPLGDCELVALEELQQGFGVDFERRILTDLALDDAGDRGRDVLRLLPVVFEPLLKGFDLAPDLDVQLDVAGQSGFCEVAGPNECG